MSTPEWAVDVADIVPPEAWVRYGLEWQANTAHGLWSVYIRGHNVHMQGDACKLALNHGGNVPATMRALLAGLRAMEAEHKRQMAKVDLDTVEAWEVVRLEGFTSSRGWERSCFDRTPGETPRWTLENAPTHVRPYRIVHRETGAVLAGEGA